MPKCFLEESEFLCTCDSSGGDVRCIGFILLYSYTRTARSSEKFFRRGRLEFRANGLLYHQYIVEVRDRLRVPRNHCLQQVQYSYRCAALPGSASNTLVSQAASMRNPSDSSVLSVRGKSLMIQPLAHKTRPVGQRPFTSILRRQPS